MPALSRRTMFKAAGSGAASALLYGCGDGAPSSVGNAGTSRVAWPAYVPFSGPPPDLPGSAQGVQAGYTKYPANLVDAVKAKPGDGCLVLAVAITYGLLLLPVVLFLLWL